MNQNLENIQYPSHEVELFCINQPYNQHKLPHQINFQTTNGTVFVDIHPGIHSKKLRTLESIRIYLSVEMKVPVSHVKLIFIPPFEANIEIETEEQWIKFCEAQEDDDVKDRFWKHSWYKRSYVNISVPKIEKIISNCQDSILNMEEYDSEKTSNLLNDFKDFLKDQDNNEADLYLQCIDAFIDFHQYGNLGALKTLQTISQENFKIAIPFLINMGCHLAKIGNFELAFSILFPIRKEHSKAIIALADLVFREGENHLINQNPKQEISEVNKKKYQFILTLLKDLKKEELLDPNTRFILEKSVTALLSKEHNLYKENYNVSISDLLGLDITISIPGSLWSVKDLEGMAQNIVEICENKGIENENVFLLKNIIKNEDNSPEYYGFLLALLKSSLSVLDIQEVCSQLPAVKDFQSVDIILPFEMIINCEKEDIQKALTLNVKEAKQAYDRSKQIQRLEGKINLDFNNEFELFAQTAIKNAIEPKLAPLTNYLLNSNGFSAIKNFPGNSKSSNALKVLSKNIEAILSNYIDYPSDEEKVSAIMNACLNAKSSIKGFTLFSKGIDVINNFMDKTLENAKKHAAQESDLEDSFEEKNWIIIEKN